MADIEEVVATRIRSDLLRITMALGDICGGLNAARDSEHRRYILAGVALDMQSVYSAIERIFRLISSTIDRSAPSGNRWHKALLTQMVNDSQRRPAVISTVSSEHLTEILNFRHVIRSVYSFELDLARVAELAERFIGWFETIRTDLLGFADFLDGGTDT